MNATTVEVCNKNQWKFLLGKYNIIIIIGKYNIIIIIEYVTTLLRVM